LPAGDRAALLKMREAHRKDLAKQRRALMLAAN